MTGIVRAIAKGGEGILYHEGKPVFIPGVLEGETVEFSIISQTSGISRGKLENVLIPSPHRAAPACRHYTECGGCNFQHIAYGQQVHYKESILYDNLKRIARLTGFTCEAITSPPFRYRSRLVLQIRNGTVGFFKRHSHGIFPVRECWQATEVVQDFISKRPAEISHVGSGQLLILTDGRQVSALLAAEGRKTYLTKQHEITFEIGSFSYLALPENFVQANLFLLSEMIGLEKDSLSGREFSSACDLFCGIGFFTMPLALHAHHVFAIENDPGNLKILRRNLEKNESRHVKVKKSDIYKTDLPSAEIYVADPPRRGLGKRLVEQIAAASPSAVILFSCDSATFSRDLLYFAERGYSPHSLKLIDNFPQTDHFEIFCVLGR